MSTERSAHSYGSIREGSQGLLGDAVRIVQSSGLEFAVVGGWSPFLLNQGKVRHRGTHDVDLLFQDGAKDGELASVVQAFTAAGYWRSAKHKFQLLKVLTVGGESFVFNVDILHAVDSAQNPEMFVDHISLPIRLSEFSSDVVVTRSMKLITSDFVFHGHVVPTAISCALPSGVETQVTVPVIDEVGTLVTKARAMESPKRERDAFDVLIAVMQARDRAELVSGLRRLERHPQARAEASRLWNLVEGGSHQARVVKHWPEAADPEVWDGALRELASVLAEGGIPRAHATQA